MPASPELLWTPPRELVEQAEMTALMREVGVEDYNALWAWSVEYLEAFWRSIWDRYRVEADGDPATVLASSAMPGARWFPDVRLSFPEHVFRDREAGEIAIQYAAEGRPVACWTWDQLRSETARVRAGLRGMGVESGDRVVACLPNVPETVAAFLAASSLGAVWSCCSPDFGARTVVDRFAQIAPKVLLAADGYRYGGRDYDRRELISELEAALPSLERTVLLRHSGDRGDWDRAFPQTEEPLRFERVPFDHPLWIVYSSGTTGLPKAIVHGHGGPLLEHLKTWRLHYDVRPGDRVLWFSTTGWIMWNYLVAALLSPVSIVLYDGNPSFPDPGALWDLVEQAGVAIFGVGAAYVHSAMAADVHPRTGRELSPLRVLGVTGSPLSPLGYRWVYERLGPGIWLAPTSGGTDIASGFVGGAPLMAVHAGEMSARMLGVAIEAWDDDGNAVADEVGELVVTKPMPSMPVRFWNDPGGERYRDSYFSVFPGVWRHGDWIRITSRGSAVIYGRSDATINRGGIRMGTAEIYSAVLSLAGIADALAVDVPSDGENDAAWLGLFVVLDEGCELNDELVGRIRAQIRSDCSPRHLPDEVVAVAAVPRTLTGKLLEVPVKRVLMGLDPGEAANRDALVNPEAFDAFIEFARRRRSRAGRSSSSPAAHADGEGRATGA
jgi:acetoacetyl-CoA synthetase